MRRQRRTILLTALLGIIIYSFCLFVLSQFGKQDQINHLAALKSDYQIFQKDNQRHSFTSWAADHQLTIIEDSNHPHTNQQRQVHDLLQQNQLDNNNPYRIKHFQGQRYLFYLLDSNSNNRQKVLIKKYQSVWQHSNLVGIFSIGYLILWLIVLALQVFSYRKQQFYLQAIVKKLQQIKDNQQTESLITKENTPYTALIHNVNALDKYTQNLVESNSLLKRRFQSLMGHLPVGVMLLDDKGNVLLHNQMLAIMLGRQIEPKVHPFVDDIQTYALSRMIEHTLRKNRNHHQQIQLYGDSNRYVDANVIRIAHSDEDLEQQVIVILYDLTEINQLGQQRQDFVEHIGQKLQPSIIEINKNITKLIKDKSQSPSVELLNIKDNAQHLDEILNDANTLNHLDTLDTILPQRLNIQELVQEYLQSQKTNIANLKLQVQSKIQGNPWLSSYKDEIQQIINNLLSNAIKFNQLNGQIKINIQHNEIENYLNIIIRDTGIGMSTSEQKHVFERFYQVDKTSHSGTGLGLSIVQEAVQALNGQLTLVSKPNKGTTVKVNIPL